MTRDLFFFFFLNRLIDDFADIFQQIITILFVCSLVITKKNHLFQKNIYQLYIIFQVTISVAMLLIQLEIVKCISRSAYYLNPFDNTK